MDFDIVISGGGIAGLTAAAAFGAEGFRVLCVDPAPPITDRDFTIATLVAPSSLKSSEGDTTKAEGEEGEEAAGGE